MQVVTDLRRGGFVYYKLSDQRGKQQVMCQTLPSMAAGMPLSATRNDLPFALLSAGILACA